VVAPSPGLGFPSLGIGYASSSKSGRFMSADCVCVITAWARRLLLLLCPDPVPRPPSNRALGFAMNDERMRGLVENLLRAREAMEGEGSARGIRAIFNEFKDSNAVILASERKMASLMEDMVAKMQIQYSTSMNSPPLINMV
jgi:hypothetical protein